MLDNEIKHNQKQYFNCVSEFAKKNLDKDPDFLTNLQSACNNQHTLSSIYTPYFDRSTYNTKYFISLFNNKVNQAYLNLGRYGYNQHHCQSFALNFTDSETKSDVHFNKMTIEESNSGYNYGEDDLNPWSRAGLIKKKDAINYDRMRAAVGNNIFPKDKNPLKYWVEQMRKENDDNHIPRIHL